VYGRCPVEGGWLKLKINKPMIAGIFLLLLMVASSFASSALQALSIWQSGQQGQSEVELPTQSVIDYQLTQEQRRQLLRSGKTIVEIEYSLACEQCTDTMHKLESAVQQYSDQMLLIELSVTNRAGLPTVRMESSYGARTMDNPTDAEIMDAFCDLFANPPVRCATMTT